MYVHMGHHKIPLQEVDKMTLPMREAVEKVTFKKIYEWGGDHGRYHV